MTGPGHRSPEPQPLRVAPWIRTAIGIGATVGILAGGGALLATQFTSAVELTGYHRPVAVEPYPPDLPGPLVIPSIGALPHRPPTVQTPEPVPYVAPEPAPVTWAGTTATATVTTPPATPAPSTTAPTTQPTTAPAGTTPPATTVPTTAPTTSVPVTPTVTEPAPTTEIPPAPTAVIEGGSA